MSRLRLTLAVGLALLGGAVSATPASALLTCGASGLPACVEAPPPGVELTLTAEENPYGLEPLTDPPAGDKLLWPRVRGHEPYGFNAVSEGTEGTTIDDEAMLHQQMGAPMARIGADWAMVQYYPNVAEGGPPWNYREYTDRRYRAYIKRGVRPLLVLARAPRRFTKNVDTARNSNAMGCGTSDACHNPPTAEHLVDLATFAADLAKRYPLAAGIEVWNEPNLSNPFWGGEPPDPARYAAMLETVHDAVKVVRPSMRVVGGALANFSHTHIDASGYERASLRAFLTGMLRAGAAANMDAISYHPYLGSYPTASTRAAQDDALFARMVAVDDAVLGGYADAGEPLNDRVIATELGASTSDGFTEERQAAWLRLRYWLWDVDHSNLRLPVDAAFFHKAVDETTPLYNLMTKAGFGFVRVKSSDGSFATKQVFCAFRTEFGGFSDCPATVSLASPAPAPPAPEPTPTEPTPTEPTPTDPAPTEPAPTEPTPTEPAPTEPKPDRSPKVRGPKG